MAFLLTKLLRGVFKVAMSVISIVLIFVLLFGGLSFFGVIDAEDFSGIPGLATVTGKASAWSQDAKEMGEDFSEAREAAEEIKDTVEEVQDKINKTQEIWE